MEAFTFAVTTQVDIPIRIKMYVLPPDNRGFSLIDTSTVAR